MLVGEGAVDEGGALGGVVLCVEGAVEGAGDVVGEVHEGGAGVEEHGDIAVVEEGAVLPVLAHACEGDDEFGVFALLRDDGQGL